MSSERALTAFAGLMVLISVALTQLVHPNFFWFTVFIGANLFQQSFTGFCPATLIMRKVFKLKSEKELARATK
ncbi:DUF2892 domain-containing protein [Cellvibrio sp.]|uniref:YgaP family membrane protein n=1 Tax=Cellvibrio sp. TaxID=1965322 RepID=UPI0039647D44